MYYVKYHNGYRQFTIKLDSLVELKTALMQLHEDSKAGSIQWFQGYYRTKLLRANVSVAWQYIDKICLYSMFAPKLLKSGYMGTFQTTFKGMLK